MIQATYINGNTTIHRILIRALGSVKYRVQTILKITDVGIEANALSGYEVWQSETVIERRPMHELNAYASIRFTHAGITSSGM